MEKKDGVLKDSNIKVPLISKIAYGMGDVGCNFSWMFVGNFLMIFYTDVFGIGMSAVAGLMLFSRFWDAVNDPIIGGLSDKTHTRWGRYRPWLLIAAPFTAVVLMISFWAHPNWSSSAKIIYMVITYCILVLGYTCVNIPYGTLCGAMTQNIEERAKINTFRSVSAMIAIGIINIITVPLIVVAGQFLFGLTLYGRNADALYYFTYVEGNQALFSTYSLFIIIPSVVGAACFPPLFKLTNNKGKAASIFALLTGVCMLCMCFFSAEKSPVFFYACSCLSQFFFSGFNTAIYAIIPDCVKYGEWKTGLRNDGFQYAFISLGNKIGMAVGTSVLAAALGSCGYAANQRQNDAVLAVMKHSFTTIPGVLWIITAAVLFFYRLNRKAYDDIIKEIQEKKRKKEAL